MFVCLIVYHCLFACLRVHWYILGFRLNSIIYSFRKFWVVFSQKAVTDINRPTGTLSAKRQKSFSPNLRDITLCLSADILIITLIFRVYIVLKTSMMSPGALQNYCCIIMKILKEDIIWIRIRFEKTKVWRKRQWQ